MATGPAAPNPTKFQKTLGVNDYYWGAPDSELPLGHIQMLGKSDRDILRAGAPWFAPSHCPSMANAMRVCGCIALSMSQLSW